MFKSIKRTSLVLLFILTAGKIFSQVPADSLFTHLLSTDKLLPALLDSAVKHNGKVNGVDESIGLAKENLAIEKKNVYSAFSLFSSYNYGNNANVIKGNITNVNLTQSNYYNAGIYLQLPLSYLISRKNSIKAGEHQVKMAEYEKEDAAQYIKDAVIQEYQEMKLAAHLVQVASEGKQAAYVNFQMSQKQFIQHDIPLTELSRIQDIYTKAAIEFEMDVNRFQTAYLKLENFTGVKLSNLIATLQ